MAAPASLEDLTRDLVSGRNADGGWGYYAGKASRLEPTCWGLLALRSSLDSGGAAVLRTWPHRGGLLLEHADGQPNIAFHAVALLTLQAWELEHEAGNAALAAALQRIEGISVEQSPYYQEDTTLQAWPWMLDTFSWVEPTAWVLLALKRARRLSGISIDSARIETAERLLEDRCCAEGGWNYGNATVFGHHLQPFVPTTALTLLALQDRSSAAFVQNSLAFLERAALSERSGLALSLALLALRASGRPCDEAAQALASQLPTTRQVGNQLSMAMAAYALAAHAAGPDDAFAV